MSKGKKHVEREKKSKISKRLKPSIREDGFVLLLPQDRVLVGIIRSEDPRKIKRDGEFWVFSVEIYSRVARKVRKFKMHVANSIYEYHMSFFCMRARENIKLPHDAERCLYAFQLESVRKAANNGGRIFLGDHSGMGKRYQALAIAGHFRDSRPLLVVCDEWMIDTWVKLAQEIIGENLAAARRVSEITETSMVTTHLLVMRHASKLQTLGHQLIVVDDVHFVTERSSYIEKCYSVLISGVDKAVLISAATDRMSSTDWFFVLRAIFRERFISFKSYRRKYGEGHGELRYLIRKVSLCRNKEDAASFCAAQDVDTSHAAEKTRSLCKRDIARHHRRVVRHGGAPVLSRNGLTEAYTRKSRRRYKREMHRKRGATLGYLLYLCRKHRRIVVILYFQATVEFLCRKLQDSGHQISWHIEGRKITVAAEHENCSVVLLNYKRLRAQTKTGSDASIFVAELHRKPERVRCAENVTGEEKMADVHYLIGSGQVENNIWHTISLELWKQGVPGTWREGASGGSDQ